MPRTASILVPLTPDEKRMILEQADADRCSAAEWLRRGAGLPPGPDAPVRYPTAQLAVQEDCLLAWPEDRAARARLAPTLRRAFRRRGWGLSLTSEPAGLRVTRVS